MIVVEPVFYTAIRPKQGQRATGLGDLGSHSLLSGG
jgi:hypothetical protein